MAMIGYSSRRSCLMLPSPVSDTTESGQPSESALQLAESAFFCLGAAGPPAYQLGKVRFAAVRVWSWVADSFIRRMSSFSAEHGRSGTLAVDDLTAHDDDRAIDPVFVLSPPQ